MQTILPEDYQSALTRHLEYQKVLTRILNKIRNSVKLPLLCATSSQDIARILKIERVAIYRFNPDWSGQFVNEYGFARAPWNSMEAFGQPLVWADSHLQETRGGRYRNHEPFAVEDIYEAGHSRCHVEVLEQFQIRAYAIAPIFIGSQLWGLLAAYQHSDRRPWDRFDIEFLVQAADYLGVAMQHHAQQQKTEHQTAALQSSVARQRALAEVVGNIRSSLDTSLILKTACQELCKLLQVERAAVYQFDDDWSGHFVCNFGQVDPQWDSSNPFGQNQVWEDTHLQETKGGRYRNNETYAVDDVYQAGHTRCHLDLLEQYKVRAYALAPVFTGSKLWGLFAAYQHSGTWQWQDFEVEFLAQVAAQIGVAVQQSNLLQKSKQQAIAFEKAISRQRTLTEVVGKIRSSLDIDLILETTCQEVCKLLEVERVAVYRFNENWSGAFVSNFGRVDSQWDSKSAFGQNQIWEDTHLQETKGGRYRNNETFAVDDIYQAGHSRCHLDLLEQYKVRAYALAPIFVGRTLWGLLAAYQHSDTHAWQTVEVEFLAQVASQLGVAIQSSTLLANSQIRAEDLEQAAEQRQILFDVVAKIRKSLDLETIFKTTAKEVRRSLKADRVGIFQFDENAHHCRGEFIAEDVLPEFVSALSVKLEDHCFGDNYAVEYAQGRIQVIHNIQAANFKECHTEFLEQFQIKAQVVVPLMKGDQLWGLMCIHQCKRTRTWSDKEVEFVQQVATQLSVALQQANLLAQTQQQTAQLSETVKELQTAQLQIIQSEKMASLGQLVAGVAHEINNPISFIHGNLVHAEEYTEELLQLVKSYQQTTADPDPMVKNLLSRTDIRFLSEDLPKLFQSMQVGTKRIQEIVMSLRNFSRLDEADVKEVDIHEGINSTLMILQNRLKPSAQNPGIQIIKDYDALPTVECYPGQLNQVFMNLLANAIDAIEGQNQVRSQAEIQEQPSKIQITTLMSQQNWVGIHITDNGPGMSEEVLNRIFDPFFTTKPVGKGTGLGLSISYQIVTEKHGGKLYCHSAPGQGTEFIVEIPIKQPSGGDR